MTDAHSKPGNPEARRAKERCAVTYAPICELPSENDLITILLAIRSKVDAALGAVSPDEFYDQVNRLVVTEIARQRDSDWGPTSIVSAIVRQHGKDAGGRALERIVALNGEPCHGDVLEHARRIREAANERRLVSVLSEALELARVRRYGQARDMLSTLERSVQATANPVGLRDAMLDAYNVAQAPRGSVALTSGHWEIDDRTGGIRPGHTWVVAGSTSAGKSSFVISIVAENCSRKHRCLIVSLEDPVSMYGARFVAREAMIRASSLRDHRIAKEDHSKITRAIASATDAPTILAVNDQPWEKVRDTIESVVRSQRIELVVLDYIQEAWSEKQFPSRQLELQAIARSFRSLVRRNKISGILCSQLTNADPGRAPTKDMVRECKDIANGAETVILLYTDNELRRANIDKCKDGRCGIVDLDWHSESASYRRVTQKGVDDWVDEIADIDEAICVG